MPHHVHPDESARLLLLGALVHVFLPPTGGRLAAAAWLSRPGAATKTVGQRLWDWVSCGHEAWRWKGGRCTGADSVFVEC